MKTTHWTQLYKSWSIDVVRPPSVELALPLSAIYYFHWQSNLSVSPS